MADITHSYKDMHLYYLDTYCSPADAALGIWGGEGGLLLMYVLNLHIILPFRAGQFYQ